MECFCEGDELELNLRKNNKVFFSFFQVDPGALKAGRCREGYKRQREKH